MTNSDAMQRADALAEAYSGQREAPAFPSKAAIDALAGFQQPLPAAPSDPAEMIALMDRLGSPATVRNNSPHYFGFVIGAGLPAAMAAERLALAWNQCASDWVNSPAAAAIEAQAGRYVLEALDLPREAAVGFGTSATACGLALLAAARRHLLERAGWDFDADGLVGAPEIRVVVSETVHITVIKALRLLGFGVRRLVRAAVDDQGRIDPAQLPPLDDHTILCLQAGEVNAGAFDPFVPLIAAARAAGAWVHVDGAFGLWARATSALKPLTEGVEGADSWTTDGHKMLNTPYDGAMGICRVRDHVARAMDASAVYAPAGAEAQKNLTLEFSRRARGIAVWAALHTLGRAGLDALISSRVALAQRFAAGLRDLGVEVLNEVAFNQVLCRLGDDAATLALPAAIQADGRIWFGGTVWQGRPAFRISVASWATEAADVDRAVAIIGEVLRSKRHA
ncbi:pyridoxal phosphate-dependent decarboxylase family protein [Maricaulis salignorans]|uniref:Aromatic-L-amino-acid decarboxylase n=1 Tax=Maricaulis salignorans TaxID=144026 RepID=A0A1G9U0R6_9PROT|nr:pyridoxal-dependent decarboxylase [Maricaulis salignorans]SDM53559.1 aromatic-L-amino-acid decarboxylase [Maricaulis salignorans]